MQPQSTQRHRGHGEGKTKSYVSRFTLCSLCLRGLCVIFGLGIGLAPAATVQTVDDATIKDASVTFDGQVLTVKSSKQPTPTTMPLEDVARIIVHEMVEPAETLPGSLSGSTAPPSGITRVRRVRRVIGTHPTTNPAVASLVPAGSWRFKLENGDGLHGALESWADQHLIVRPDVAPDSEVGIAAGNLKALWRGDAADEAKAEAMVASRGDDDVAFVRKDKDADIVAVHGAASNVDGNELIFHYQDQDRRINLAKLIGIVFAQRSAASKPDDSFHEVLRFTDGEQISGQWKLLAGNRITLETDGAKQVKFPMGAVASIEFRNGRITYLSDLTPAKIEQTPFFDQIIPFKTDSALGGGPLRLGNRIYDKGLAVHSRCVLEYDLGGRFDRFRTTMGFEPVTGAMGDAIVRVLGDGKPLYENTTAKGTDSPVPIDVDANGISHLTLQVDFGNGQDVGDRVVWADARAVRAKVGG